MYSDIGSVFKWTALCSLRMNSQERPVDCGQAWPRSGSDVGFLPSPEKGAAPALGSDGSGGARFPQGVPRAPWPYLSLTFTHTLSAPEPASQTPAEMGTCHPLRPEGHLGGHRHTYICFGTVSVPSHFKCSIEECLKDSLGPKSGLPPPSSVIQGM